MDWNHNHSINSAFSLQYRDVSEETKSRLLELFKMGYSVSQSRNILAAEVMAEAAATGQFHTKMADRRIFPDYFFIRR